MPSRSLDRWLHGRAAALDELESAHQAVGGTGPGRRASTQQIVQAYVLMLSSQFQAFCRDLHTEAVDYLVAPIALVDLKRIAQADLTTGRKLDQGNPNPSNIGADFSRIGLVHFWRIVASQDRRNSQRQKKLEDLNGWRNAIAHQDAGKIAKLQTQGRLQLGLVTSWRSACVALARHFDVAVQNHLRAVVGSSPW